MLTAVDCQGFAGGFTLGMTQAGFDILAKREESGGFGVEPCAANAELLRGLADIQVSSAEDWAPRTCDVVFGNPPCTGFSVLNKARTRGIDSPVNECMRKFWAYAARCQPTVAAMESVTQAYTDGADLMRQLRQNLERDANRKYALYHVLHSAEGCDGYQRRKRYAMVCSRIPLKFKLHQRENPHTARSVIDDLVTAALDSRDGHFLTPTTNHTQRVVQAFKLYAELWKPGQTLDSALANAYFHDGRDPFTELAEPWSEAQIFNAVSYSEFSSGFQVRRLHHDKLFPVITGAAMTNLAHYSLSRLITHRECARAMGFPDEWSLECARDVSISSNWYGKGVTVQCGRWLGSQIYAAISGENAGREAELIGDREFFIDVDRESAA